MGKNKSSAEKARFLIKYIRKFLNIAS